MKTFFHVIPREQSDRGNLSAPLKIAALIARNDKSRGFTLVEIIVVMAITAIVGTILVLIFTNTLRGSNKAQVLAVIKQNGQAVLDNIDKNIRNSDSVACFTPSGNTLVIVKNGIYSRYRFYVPDNPSYCGTNNGCIQQDNPVQPIPPDLRSSIQVFMDNINGICNDTDPLINPVTLTDTNIQSGVSVSSGNFSVNKSSGYMTSVTINFTLKAGTGVPTAISDQIDSVSFQTTIGLR